MSLVTIISCNAQLANGHKCETRMALDPGASRPPGWVTICRSRPPTLEDAMAQGGANAGMLAAVQNPPPGIGKEQIDQIMRQILHSVGLIEEEADLCPLHSSGVPAAEFRPVT